MPEGCCCAWCVSRYGFPGGKKAAKRKRRRLRNDDQPALDAFTEDDA